MTDPNYNVTRYGNDAENERTSQQVTIHDASGNPVAATTTWTYDSAGNLQSQVDADNRTIV
ncbi:MAG TPA: hypothetical protein VGY55_22210 [Pirellulales bacterium]|nr:hypothetical protein [Pirellulales bacterium]